MSTLDSLPVCSRFRLCLVWLRLTKIAYESPQKLQSFPNLETEVQNLLFDVLEDYQDMANKHLTAMVEAQRAFINVRYGHYLGDFSSFHFNLLMSIGLILASGRSLYIFL